jgi:hypothetical protein
MTMDLPARQPLERDPELAEIEAEFPAWRCWRGVGGLLYARRLNSSPPIVIPREENTVELRSRIKIREAEISARLGF